MKLILSLKDQLPYCCLKTLFQLLTGMSGSIEASRGSVNNSSICFFTKRFEKLPHSGYFPFSCHGSDIQVFAAFLAFLIDSP